MTATIVIPTKNAGNYIEETLHAIYQQETDFEFDVLVIDSGSKDRTLEILTSYPARVIQIPPETFNHGETRNLGAKEARPESEVIVLLSQDAKPYNNLWLQNLIMPFREDPQVAGVFSRHVPRPDTQASVVRQLVTWTQTGGENRLVKKMPESQAEYHANRFWYFFFSNTSSALRREVWQKFPFDRTDFAEDALWADKVIRNGYTIIFEPASIIMHSHNYSVIEQFRQNVDHSHAMNKLFQPEPYKSRRYWLKLFVGIPIQVKKDYEFVMKNAIYADKSIWYKTRMILTSLPWQTATVCGAWVGANLDEMPDWLKFILSRQERIKSR